MIPASSTATAAFVYGYNAETDSVVAGAGGTNEEIGITANGATVSAPVKSVSIDTTPPTSTISSVAYDSSAGTITFTGTNFGTAGANGVDIKSQIDWTKLAWDIDGDGSSTAGVVFTVADITSAVVTNDTTLTITLADNAALQATAGFAADGIGATNAADNIDVTAGFVRDAALNPATTDAASNLAPTYSDSTKPTITTFTTTSTTPGNYGIGDDIDITATASEAVLGGSSITVTLDSGSTATAVLTADANGTSLTGSYTVASGHSSSDLTVSSFVISSTAPVTDIYGNVATSTTVPSSPNNLADSAALDVDGAPPTSTITAAAYNDTANTITLTGTNFDTIDGSDLVVQISRHSWTGHKFTWDIDGDSSATGGTFVVGDIDSAVVTSATVLTITLDTTGIAKLEGSAGEGVAGFAASSVGATYPDPDNIDILAGFISDDAGNAATTDAATDVAPSYADSAAPTISSFTSTTADGSKGVGDTIDIVATMSEAVVKGSSITVTLNSSSTATAVLTAAANGTTMTGTYTVSSGDRNARFVSCVLCSDKSCDGYLRQCNDIVIAAFNEHC